MAIEKFIQTPMSDWMKQSAPDQDIVISSRIRLARNLRHYPFPMMAADAQLEEIVRLFEGLVEQGQPALDSRLEFFRADDLSALTKKVLVEKHLISPLFAEESRKGGLILSRNEAVSIMINEEDHLRIQILYPGFQLKEAWEKANEVDDWLESRVEYAFDERRGYLTSCPTNVGTGIRASVMVHLPALVMTKQINRILSAVNQVGLAVRGVYGEGSEAAGNLFQISNQLTLGHSEEEIIENLTGVVRQIIGHERSAREALLGSMRLQLEDKIHRSFGILAHARTIESKEATARLSDVRLGVDLGMIKGLGASDLNQLWVMIQPGFIQTYFRERLTPEQRDEHRATLLREHLATKSQ